MLILACLSIGPLNQLFAELGNFVVELGKLDVKLLDLVVSLVQTHL